MIAARSRSGTVYRIGPLFVRQDIWLPKCNRTRSRPGWVEPEVFFRVVHLAQNGHNSAPVAAYREQTVEIALGPKGAFENGNIGTLTRRVAADRVVSALPPLRGEPKPPTEPKTPQVIELFRKAIEWPIEWQSLLESGKIATQAEITRHEGISRARVTQIMGMLRLDLKIQEQILSMPDADRRPLITERILRQLVTIADHNDQLRKFQQRLSAP